MTRTRTTLALCAVVVVALLPALTRGSAGDATIQSSGALETITADQLEHVGVQLEPINAAPQITEAEASKIAGAMDDEQPEIAFADCTRFGSGGAIAEAPCWAVSFKAPPGAVPVLRGPDPEYSKTHPVTIDFELVLVDADTGNIMIQIRDSHTEDPRADHGASTERRRADGPCI